MQQLGLELGGLGILLQAIRFGQDGWFDRFSTSFENSFNTVYAFAEEVETEALDLASALSCYDDAGQVGTGFYSSTATSFPGRASNFCSDFEVGSLVRIEADPATFRSWTRMKFRIELGRDPTSQEMQEFTSLLSDAYREQFEAAHG